jgi:hypothetical protein
MRDKEELQERLRQVAKWFPASEIARRTHTSDANVHRYLHGTRVPAWFCSRVVREFGINPAWLLAGEGPPRVNDVAAAASHTGSEMLSLIESMNAIEHLRLGSLAGSDNLKVLHGLRDALARHEQLRRRLDEKGTPLLARLLEDFRRYLDADDLPSARALSDLAVAVARFSDDAELQSTLLYLRANEAWKHFDREKAADLQYRLLTARLAFGRLSSPDQLLAVQKHAMWLTWHGNPAEAMRVTRAALALIPPEMRRNPEVADTRIMYADAMSHTRRPDRAAAIAQRNVHRMTSVPSRREFGRQVLLVAQLFAGFVTVDELMARPLPTLASVDMLQTFAIWSENPALMRRILETGRALRPDSEEGTMPVRALCDAVYRAMQPSSEGGPLSGLLPAARDSRLGGFQGQVRVAQIYRLRGKWRECRAETIKAARLWAQHPPDDLPDRLDEATHVRNVLTLAVRGGRFHPGDKVVREARKLLRFLRKNRYGFVAPLDALAAALDAK